MVRLIEATSPASVSAIAFRMAGPRTGKMALAISRGFRRTDSPIAPFDRRRERAGQLAVAAAAEGDGLRQQLGQLLAAQADRVQPPLQLLEPAPLGAEQQLAQLGQLLRGGVRIARRRQADSQGARSSGIGVSSAGRSSPGGRGAPTRAASSESRLESEALSVLVVLSS